MIALLDKNLIKENLTEHDIELILTDLGSNGYKVDPQGNMIFQTVCHNVEGGKYKLYYYADTCMFRCYTECGESFDIYELVTKSKGIRGIKLTFYEAVQYVANITGKSYSNPFSFSFSENNLIDDWEWINRLQKPKKPEVKLTTYDPKVLDVFLPIPHDDWIKEGISEETMQKYGVRYYVKDHKIILPYYDIDSNLVAIRGRATKVEDIEAGKKYMPVTIENKLYNCPTSFYIYGLYQNQETIRRMKKVMIFEAEKSVLKCEDFYRENNFTVASCGSNISNFQRDMILELGVEEVFIAFDKEFHVANSNEAYEYAEKLKKLAYKFAPYVRVYIIWDGTGKLAYKESPVDQGKEVLEFLMKNKYEVKTKEGKGR